MDGVYRRNRMGPMNVGHPDASDNVKMQARGVLALELAPGTTIDAEALVPGAASRLATLLARDLARLVPGVDTLDFCLAAAHFDPAEALRPGWPLHRRLDELHARAPRGDGSPRIMAFGADAEGNVPQPLQCDPSLRGGQLRVLPWSCLGDPSRMADVADALESVLLDQGMVQPDTALCAQDAFGARVEHARAMTAHDLTAMMALQYENAGLSPLWPVIETALLAPGRSVTIDAPPEPFVHYADGEVRITLLSATDWRSRHGGGDNDAERLRRRFAQFEMRQKQFAAVLAAHGIPVLFEHDNNA